MSAANKKRKRRSSTGSTTKRHVLHDYHDHAFEQEYDSVVTDSSAALRLVSGADVTVYPEVVGHKESETCSSTTKPKQFMTAKNKIRRGPRGGVEVPFPLKLHRMLSHAEKDGFEHIVSWQPHGRCFRLHKPKNFVSDIMHKFFKQSKLTSFQRQLNLYGFSRLTIGPDSGSYYHELFLRGKEFLSKKMLRTRIKGTGSKPFSSPAMEPDFYKMNHLPALQGEEETENKERKKVDTDPFVPHKISRDTSHTRLDFQSELDQNDPVDEMLTSENPLLLLPPLVIPAPSLPSFSSALQEAVPVTPSISSPHAEAAKKSEFPSDLMLGTPLPPLAVDEAFLEGEAVHALDESELNPTFIQSSDPLDSDTVGLPIDFASTLPMENQER